MAVITNSNQYKYTGRGPLDTKALVKTYADLTSLSTWQVKNGSSTTVIAYNGMITAVWLNKEDTSKNGIYFLFDPAVTSALKAPDVTNESNWHRLGSISSEELTKILGDYLKTEDFNTAISTKADTSEVEAIKSQVTTLTGDLVAVNNAILEINARLDDYAKKEEVVLKDAFSDFQAVINSDLTIIKNTYAKKADVEANTTEIQKLKANLAEQQSIIDKTCFWQEISTT